MSDLDFDALDAVDPPDQWPDILSRAEHPTELPAHPKPRRSLVISAAAVVAAVAAVAGLVAVTADGNDPVATEGQSLIVCDGGGLAPGSVPETASPEPSASADTVQPGQQALTWPEGGLSVELLVPAHQYIDFLGERTENVGSPKGLVWYRPTETRFLGRTGLEGSCDSYELTVSGGDEPTRAALLHDISARLAWDPTLALRDCGPLSADVVQSYDVPGALDAIADVGVADLSLDSASGVPASRLPDGRCEITALTEGGMPVQVTVSGDDGTYAVDRIVGFPDGVDPLGTYSGRRTGRRIAVDLDYWCDDCAEATLTVSYPDQDIRDSRTITQQGTFELELSETPEANPAGIQAIVYRAANGDVRGVFVVAEPAFIIESVPSVP